MITKAVLTIVMYVVLLLLLNIFSFLLLEAVSAVHSKSCNNHQVYSFLCVL